MGERDEEEGKKKGKIQNYRERTQSRVGPLPPAAFRIHAPDRGANLKISFVLPIRHAMTPRTNQVYTGSVASAHPRLNTLGKQYAP